ncbi:exo-alpha-sialidase [Pontibacter sp. 172403-2]|uniref:sialidase family protein n=1 Tax=Pontibacter rufus TaxID=2791028 RepID=UPI0018AF7643|nr:sialidase family protein [Pontibacter sp. 172403-2]MBF9254615.1 exo-alpha-sialidase [Pontibacter sp. 172403-2]
MKVTFLLSIVAHLAVAQTSSIVWGQKVLVNNEPYFEAGAQEGRNHGKYGSEYGRMLKLDNGSWLAAYTVSRNNGYLNDPNGGLELEVSVSNDTGRHWQKLSVLSDEGRDLDNAQLIQLPDKSILLACRSVRWQESYRLPVYRSTDGGRTWAKLSTIDSNEGKPGELGKPDKGAYEPHFYFLDDGRLSVMYANEKHVTDSVSYSQIISQKTSPDYGKTWGKEVWVAYEPGHGTSRPGMPVWTKMKNGKYIAVYEICGPEKCNIYYKTSADGITWPVGLGIIIPDQLGGPYILSVDDGRLVVTSNQSNISISDDYGQSWHKTAPAWDNTLWSALYQTGPDEIGIINSVRRSEGGHNIQVRFGKISR